MGHDRRTACAYCRFRICTIGAFLKYSPFTFHLIRKTVPKILTCQNIVVILPNQNNFRTRGRVRTRNNNNQTIMANIPENLRYTREHEWIRVEGNEAFVGITDFAQSELGEIVFVDVDTVGETIAQGEVFGSVEAVKTVSDLNMPVSGEVLEFNESLNDAPEKVNQDPYGEGWMIRISVNDTAELFVIIISMPSLFKFRNTN